MSHSRTILMTLMAAVVTAGSPVAASAWTDAGIPCPEGQVCLYSEPHFTGSQLVFRNAVRPHFLVRSAINNDSDNYCLRSEAGVDLFLSDTEIPDYDRPAVDEAYRCPDQARGKGKVAR